jgi:hypothetical protein
MTRTSLILVIGLIAVVLAVALGSCRNPSPTPLPPPWPEPAPPDTVTYFVVAPCGLQDDCGSDVQSIAVRQSTPIQWVNKTPGNVAIFFEPPRIVGRDHIYLPSGKSYVTTTCGSGFSGPEFQVTVKCEGMQGPTPPIKECPPPPAPCP